MSSVNSRIIIESYINGGYGVFIDRDKEEMGLKPQQALRIFLNWINNEEKRLK